jgi:hypothetical protein
MQDTGALTPRQCVAPAVTCLTIAAYTLWCLGFPAQAVRRCQDTLALAQEIEHPMVCLMPTTGPATRFTSVAKC